MKVSNVLLGNGEFLINNLTIINQKENAVLLALKGLLARLAPLVLGVFLDLLVPRVFLDLLAPLTLLVHQALVLVLHQKGIMI